MVARKETSLARKGLVLGGTVSNALRFWVDKLSREKKVLAGKGK